MRSLPASFLLLALALSPVVAEAQATALDAPPAATPPDPSAPPAAASEPLQIEVPPPVMPPPAPIAPVSCSAGRTATEATLGRCCWPGQSFSAERARCEGAPLCPPGWTAHGDDCVVTSVAPPSHSSATQSFQLIEAVSPRPPETVSTMQHGVLGAGVTLLLAGYVASATYGPIFGSPSCDASGLIWLAPIAGSLIGAATQRCWHGGGSDTADWVMAVGTAALQIVGLVLVISGATSRRTVTIARGADGSPLAELELGASPTVRF